MEILLGFVALIFFLIAFILGIILWIQYRILCEAALKERTLIAEIDRLKKELERLNQKPLS